MKAIKVTEDNLPQLATQFEDVAVDELEDSIGYWLLANYGDSAAFEGFIFDEDFYLEWKKVGDLENGWIEVV